MDMTGEFEGLCALAARLIPGAAPAQFGQPTVVRPAALPPHILPELPLPAGSWLVGSCTSGSFSLVFLDSEPSPGNILRFYQEELGNRGWYRHDMRGSSGSLTLGDHAPIWALFCRDLHGPSLHASALSRPTGSELQLQIEIDPQRTPCARHPGPRPSRTRDLRRPGPLPELTSVFAVEKFVISRR